MSALGSLVVKLSLDYAEYIQGIDRSDQSSLKFAQNTQRNFDAAARSGRDFFSGMVSGALQAGVALLSINAVTGRLSSSIDMLARLDDASQKTGSSVENLSRIQKTAASMGHEFDPIEASISRLAKGMATVDSESNKTNKALAALGISSRDTNGNLRDAADVTLEIAQKLQGYRDNANKSAVATDLWGKSGADMLPILNDVADNVHRFTGESEESAQAASHLQDSMSGLRGQVDEAFTAFAIDLMPTLKSVTGAMTSTAGGTTLLSTGAKVAKSMIDQLVITGAAAGFVFTSLGKIVSTAAGQLISMTNLDLAGAAASGRQLVQDLAQDYKDYSAFAEKILIGNAEIAASNAEAAKKPPLKTLNYETGNDAAAKKLESLNDAARKYIETLKTETLAVGQTAIQTKLLAAAQVAAATPSRALGMEIMTQAQAWARLAQFQEDAKEEFAALQEREDAFREASNAITDYGRSIDMAAESAQFELSIMGKSALEREIAIEQRRAELELKKQILAITDQVTNADDQAALIEQANADGARAQAAARLTAIAKSTQEDWTRMWSTVEQTGKLAFVNILANGVSSMKSIGAAIKASVIDLLYQLTVRKWIINIGTSFSGMGSASVTASGGGGDMLSGLSRLFSMGGGSEAGAAASTGFSGIGGASGGLGGISGAAGGAGGMMAAAGPVAAAAAAYFALTSLGGAMGKGKKLFGMKGDGIMNYIPFAPGLFGVLTGLFGKGPKILGPSELTGDFTAAGFSGEFQADWTRKVGLFGGKKSGRRGLGISSEMAQALNKSTATITESFQSLIKYTGDAGRSLDGWSFSVRRQIDTEEQQAALTVDLSNSIGTKLIPELVAVQQHGEQLADTALRMRQELGIVNQLLDLTKQSLGATGLAALGVADRLIQALGGAQNAGAQLSAYYQSFYTTAEQSASGWRLLNAEMTRLGVQSLPTSRDRFRALVEAQDLSTSAGQDMFAALISLAPAFASLTAEAIQAQAAITLLTTDSFATLVDYTRYIRLAANAGVGPAPADPAYQAALGATGSVGLGNAALLDELRALRAEQKAGDIAIATATAQMANIMSRWEGDGMPDIRDIAA